MVDQPAAPGALAPAPTADSRDWNELRFATRGRALFFGRLAFLTIGLGILAIPSWSDAFGASRPAAFVWYFFMLGYSVASYLLIDKGRLGRWITFATLLLDLVMLVYLTTRSGGLYSPVMGAQVLFTMFFGLLFPRPIAILPPLLTLPIVLRLRQIVYGQDFGVAEVFVLMFLITINFIVVFITVYLNEREESQHREILKLQRELRELAVVEERERLARDIHDGLGAGLSSLIIQAEYLGAIAETPEVKREIAELKTSAEEAMFELRRALAMMHDAFDLVPAIEEYCQRFRERTRIDASFEVQGTERPLAGELQLAVFRIVQESLTNVAKHAEAEQVAVRLTFEAQALELQACDDGRGFELGDRRKAHYGLANMRERARKVGGELTIDTAPGEGTEIVLRVDGLKGPSVMSGRFQPPTR